MNHIPSLIVGSLALLLTAVTPVYADTAFETNLRGNQEVPPVTTDATGEIRLNFATSTNNASSTADFKITVNDGDNITMAHLHCAPVGENGPIIAPLFGMIEGGFDVDGTLAEFTLTDANILPAGEECDTPVESITDLKEAIEDGIIYANVHSVEHPNGLIRGQLGTTTGTTTPGGNGTTTPDTVTINIMKHLCPSNIQTETQFDALGNFGEKLATCPTIVKPANAAATGTIAGPERNFNFIITSETNGAETTSTSTFAQDRICETDLNQDLNDNNTIASTTCFDASHYRYQNIPNGDVTVTEAPPTGARLGSLEFTPDALGANNDSESLISTGTSTIELDTTEDTDGEITLHVYNFVGTSTATTTPDGNGTTTPDNGNGTTTPDTRQALFDRLADALNDLLDILADILDVTGNTTN